MPWRKTLKTGSVQSPEGFKLLNGAPGDVCRVCAVLQYLEHRSCGDTQPLTLPEYGDRKTIIPLTVEKNSQNKTKQKKMEKFKWRKRIVIRVSFPTPCWKSRRFLYQTTAKYTWMGLKPLCPTVSQYKIYELLHIDRIWLSK